MCAARRGAPRSERMHARAERERRVRPAARLKPMYACMQFPDGAEGVSAVPFKRPGADDGGALEEVNSDSAVKASVAWHRAAWHFMAWRWTRCGAVRGWDGMAGMQKAHPHIAAAARESTATQLKSTPTRARWQGYR